MTNIKYGSVKYNFQGMTIVFHVHANSSFTKCFSFLLTFFTHLYLCPRMLCKKYFGAIRFKPFGMFLAYSMIIIIIFTENFGKRVKHCIPLQEISHCPPLCEGQWSPLRKTLVGNYQRNLVSVLPFTGFPIISKYNIFFNLYIVKQTKAKSFLRIMHKPKIYLFGPSRIQCESFLVFGPLDSYHSLSYSPQWISVSSFKWMHSVQFLPFLVVWTTIVVFINLALSIHCCIFQVAFIFILPRPSIHYYIFQVSFIFTLPKYSLLHLSSGWRTRTLGDSRGTKHHLLLEGVSNKDVYED